VYLLYEDVMTAGIVFHCSKLSWVVFLKGGQYDVVCICTCVTNIILEENFDCFFGLYYIL
jgi:hypothetical protein